MVVSVDQEQQYSIMWNFYLFYFKWMNQQYLQYYEINFMPKKNSTLLLINSINSDNIKYKKKVEIEKKKIIILKIKIQNLKINEE